MTSKISTYDNSTDFSSYKSENYLASTKSLSKATHPGVPTSCTKNNKHNSLKQPLQSLESQDITFQPFETLPTSTATVMVYSNIKFNHSKIFSGIKIYDLDPPLTKKKKNIDKKRLWAPYGAIIGMQHYVYIRGIRTSKPKKYWCPMCQIVTTSPEGEEIQELTVCEDVKPITEEEIIETSYPSDTKKIHFFCNKCKREFQLTELRKIVPFLNQVTIVLSLDKVMINIMMFKDNCKLSGNKSMDDAYETIMILWEDYISSIEKGWILKKRCRVAPTKNSQIQFKENYNKNIGISTKDVPMVSSVVEYSKQSQNKSVQFLFELVMKNVDFKLGFPFDKKRLNELINNEKYRDHVDISHCETTSATHVNIKMHTKKPNNFKYDILVYDINSDGEYKNSPYFVESVIKLFATKKQKAKPITFIVFASSEIILTGRYDENMKEQYEFFISTVKENKDFVQERILKPKHSLKDYMRMIAEEEEKSER